MKSIHSLYTPGETRRVITFFKSMVRKFPMEFGESTRDVCTLYDTYDQSLAHMGYLFVKGQTVIRLIRFQTFSDNEYSPEGDIRKDWWKHPTTEWEQSLQRIIPLQSLFPIWSGVCNTRTITVKNHMLDPVGVICIMSWGRETLIHVSGDKKEKKFLNEINEYLLHNGFVPQRENWSLYLMRCKGKQPLMVHSLERILVSSELPLRRAAGDIILNYLHTARYYEKGIIEDIDTECLHKFRVLIRKIRSIIGLLHTVFPPDDITWLKEEFKAVQQMTNTLRDLDVETLQSSTSNSYFPSNRMDLSGGITEHLEEKRAREHEIVSQYLLSKEYTTTIQRLKQYFETLYQLPESEAAIQPAGVAAKQILMKIYRKVRKKSGMQHTDLPDDVIHGIRIDIKRIRYMIEFFQPLLPKKPTMKLIKQMKKVQNILGDYNDLAIQGERLWQDAEALDTSGTREKRLLSLGIMIGCLYTRHTCLKQDVLMEMKMLRRESIRVLMERITT